jgi:hypothetical protein
VILCTGLSLAAWHVERIVFEDQLVPTTRTNLKTPPFQNSNELQLGVDNSPMQQRVTFGFRTKSTGFWDDQDEKTGLEGDSVLTKLLGKLALRPKRRIQANHTVFWQGRYVEPIHKADHTHSRRA